MVNFLRPHVGNFTATRGSCILTMQRYNILIAVYECFLSNSDKNARTERDSLRCSVAVRNLIGKYPKFNSIFIYKYRSIFRSLRYQFWNCSAATRNSSYFARKNVAKIADNLKRY